jgi:hypothetical protein
LSEKKDVYQEAKKQMRLSERLMAALPGFRGYKEKEIRRESDKLVRNHLYHKLIQARSTYKTVFQKAADQRQLDVFSDMDRLSAKFDRVTEKVGHATYGYSGFFDAVKIQEEALDRMTDFDNQLIDQTNSITTEVNSLKSDIVKQNFDTLKDHVQNLSGLLEAFDALLSQREEVIMGVT